MIQRHVFATRLTGARVDLEKRIIYGVNVMTLGRAMGHGKVDETTLRQFVATVASEKTRGREDHPEENLVGVAPVGKKVEDLRGYFFNPRIEGDKVLMDFQALSEAAAGVSTTRLLNKANEAPEIFGVSPVFFGPLENGFHRVQSVVAIDFVDIPAGDSARQQLFQGRATMKFSISKNEKGEAFVACDADGAVKAGEMYSAEFPPEEKKAEMAAEDPKKPEEKKAELAAEEPAAQKDLTPEKKTFSAQEVAAAEERGAAKHQAFHAGFDGVMDAIDLKGEARDVFRKEHFSKAQRYEALSSGAGLGYAKDMASMALSARAKPVGGGGGGQNSQALGRDDEELGAINRFHANKSLRRGWMADAPGKLDDPKAPEYVAGLTAFILQRRETGNK